MSLLDETHSDIAWRKLGYFYIFDQDSNEQCIFGDRAGIRAFISELRSYGNSKFFQHLGAHDHIGPYMYLELRTSDCAGIHEGLIQGLPEDFLKLAVLIESELAVLDASNTIIIEHFGANNSVPLKLSVKPDGFDPASMDWANI